MAIINVIMGIFCINSLVHILSYIFRKMSRKKITELLLNYRVWDTLVPEILLNYFQKNTKTLFLKRYFLIYF